MCVCVCARYTDATHSKSLDQAIDAGANGKEEAWKKIRTPEWSNPEYMHPWFMTYEDAKAVWTGVDGLEGI